MQKLTRLGWMAIAALILGGIALLASCQSGLNGINVVQKAGLAATTTLEIQELASRPGTDQLRQDVISDPATVQQLVKTLDRRLPLRPLADCLPEYQLRFLLADGRVEEFGYLCAGGSFLQGDQPFWGRQQIQPPSEFDELMRRVLEGWQ